MRFASLRLFIAKGNSMINTYEVVVASNQKEIFDRDNEGLLYICQRNYFDNFYEKKVPWHWHNELELAYITNGDFCYSFAECKAPVHKGDFLFINSNVLHGILPEDNDLSGCTMDVIRFDYNFLSGGYNSNIARRYFVPLIGCNSIPFHVFTPDTSVAAGLIYDFSMAFKADEEEVAGHEFEVQRYLSKLWLSMLSELAPLIEEARPLNDSSLERLKVMMSFIHDNYSEKLTLHDIADSASISERECSRCFSVNLSQTPIEYLNNYRTGKAAEMLLAGRMSVLEISEECGFSSGSYFSKMFGRIMKCTPLEYRKKNRKN